MVSYRGVNLPDILERRLVPEYYVGHIPLKKVWFFEMTINWMFLEPLCYRSPNGTLEHCLMFLKLFSEIGYFFSTIVCISAKIVHFF